MKRIYFMYPFMLFHKCVCSQQNYINEVQVQENNYIFTLTTDVTCSTCGQHITSSYEISEESNDMSRYINAFKVIPSIKDEVALVKLDKFKGKIKKGELFFYGNYSHLRFFDNIIENDIIPVLYTVK